MSEKAKIIYVVPSLKRSGPTKQLLMIVEAASKNFDVEVLLLKEAPPEQSLASHFYELGVSIKYLGGPAFKYRSKFAKYLSASTPQLVHSHGFLPDFLLASSKFSGLWISSIRNYCWEDYPMKFGTVVGMLLAVVHVWALKKADHPVACSQYLSKRYSSHNITSQVIRNGVTLPSILQKKSQSVNKRKCVLVVGSLIKRKNNLAIIKAHKELSKNEKIDLTFIGDGPEMKVLQSASGDNVNFIGQVDDVTKWYRTATLFVSNSLSEGMPNSVLEAISHQIPCLLSSIEPHIELALEFPQLIDLIGTCETAKDTAKKILKMVSEDTATVSNVELNKISHSFMAQEYLNLYFRATRS